MSEEKQVLESGVWKTVVSKVEFNKRWTEKVENHQANCIVEDCDICSAFRNFSHNFKIKKDKI